MAGAQPASCWGDRITLKIVPARRLAKERCARAAARHNVVSLSRVLIEFRLQNFRTKAPALTAPRPLGPSAEKLAQPNAALPELSRATVKIWAPRQTHGQEQTRNTFKCDAILPRLY